MTRWLEKLSDAFWAWLDHILEEPEERLDPPHEYYERGTIGFKRLGDKCRYCGAWDAKRRAHNDDPCERPYRPELA